ncbi:MAG: DUF2279 domain-containing protein [Bacteroidetes bacterium]|nr:DUF2279 domain-containing protein [Bacteroidota bacterium]
MNKSRLHKLAGGFAIGFGGSLYLLNKAWYSKETGTSFHFYNDMDHWNQIDKSGHFWSAFQQSRLGVDMLLWSGMDRIQSIWIGGMLGVVLQAPIEVFDGFSDDYGASWSDFGFNMAGSTFLIAQQLAWNEIRIMPKYSFHTTAYAPLRPQTFGKSLPEQMLKDYNGQSYWLSFNLSAFLPHDSNYPKWLNIATGYAASQMVYGSPRDNNNYGYTAYRRFFISPDINLQNIKTSSKFLKKTFYILSAFRIPMPAIELNSKMQVKFHPLYY